LILLYACGLFTCVRTLVVTRLPSSLSAGSAAGMPQSIIIFDSVRTFHWLLSRKPLKKHVNS